MFDLKEVLEKEVRYYREITEESLEKLLFCQERNELPSKKLYVEM